MAAGLREEDRLSRSDEPKRRQVSVGALSPAVAYPGRAGVSVDRRRALCERCPRSTRRMDPGESIRDDDQLGHCDGGLPADLVVDLALPRLWVKRWLARSWISSALPSDAVSARRLGRAEPGALGRFRQSLHS